MFAIARSEMTQLVRNRLVAASSLFVPLAFSAVLIFNRENFGGTAVAAALILVVGQIMAKETAAALGGTTALLLLGVFAVVNVAVIVLRKDKSREGTGYFRAPAFIPFIGAATTLFLIGPWAQDVIEYQIAAVLLGIGLLLSAVNWAYKRFVKHEPMGFEDTQAIATLGEEPGGHDPLGDYSTHEHHRK